MRCRRSVVIALVGALSFLSMSGLAVAVPGSSWGAGKSDPQGGSVEAGQVVTVGGGSKSQAGESKNRDSGPWDPWAGNVECRYAVASPAEAVQSGLTPGPDEVVAVAYCPGNQPTFSVIAEPAAGAPVPAVDPIFLMEVARSRLVLPQPAIEFNPAPPNEQVVQLASWLWIDPVQWRSASASASAGSVTATVSAAPVRVVWDMGNGDRVACAGPGRVYEPRFADSPEATDCKYTYVRSSAGVGSDDAYTVTATVEWALSWSVTGAAGGGPLGTVAMSAATPLQVAELQALVQ